ncbi:unnamed protein product [Absidia cylindrospora]
MHHLGQRDLYHCALVNTRFHTAAAPLLWATVRLFHFTKAPKMITSLPSTGHHVRTLDMRNHFAKETTLLHVMKYTRLLERLYYVGDSISDDIFLLLPNYCPNLTTIYFVHGDMYGLSLDTLVQQCHHLRHLGLRGCRHLSCTSFAGLKASSLETLSIGGHLSVEDWAALELGLEDLLGMPTLTHFGLWKGPPRFVRRLFKTHAYLMPQLTQLALDVDDGLFSHIDVDMVASFLQQHPHLTGLDLRKSQCTDRVLETIAALLPHLTYLDVSHCPAISLHGVRQLVMHCPRLAFVGLGSCGLDASDFPELNSNRRQTDGDFNLNKKMMNKIRGNSICDTDHGHVDDNRDEYWAMKYDELR